MGKGSPDWLPPHTVEGEGTAEMEKSMSRSEGAILQFSANVFWSNNSNSLILTEVKDGGGYYKDKERPREKARNIELGLGKDRKQEIFGVWPLTQTHTHTFSLSPLVYSPLRAPFPLSNNQLVHDFCLNIAIPCSSLHTLTF